MTIYQKSRYPDDNEAKESIIEIGKRIYNRGFVAANDGNISCKVSESTFWITPTGVSKGFMSPDMLIKLDLKGNILNGTGKPSSESGMHLRVYRENPNIGAVVHAHPPVATAYAVAGIPLDLKILPEAIVNLGEIPLAPYATPGSAEVAEAVAPYCKTHNGLLLANHGALTWGANLLSAHYRMETLEYFAQLCMNTEKIIGQLNKLNDNQLDELNTIRNNLLKGSIT